MLRLAAFCLVTLFAPRIEVVADRQAGRAHARPGAVAHAAIRRGRAA